MNASLLNRYEQNAKRAFQAPDGRYYRRSGNRIEVLCRQRGDWRMLRTASQPFIDFLKTHVS
jgi:hypothetical protein